MPCPLPLPLQPRPLPLPQYWSSYTISCAVGSLSVAVCLSSLFCHLRNFKQLQFFQQSQDFQNPRSHTVLHNVNKVVFHHVTDFGLGAIDDTVSQVGFSGGLFLPLLPVLVSLCVLWISVSLLPKNLLLFSVAVRQILHLHFGSEENIVLCTVEE